MTAPHLSPPKACVSGWLRQLIGVLQEGPLKSPFSLTEMRVLYELRHREKPSAADVARDLGLDAGYLSRILRSFQKQGLIRKSPSETDHRQTLLSLTAKAMRTVEQLLGSSPADRTSYVIRAPEPGDMGWVVHRHGALYAREYGLNDQFEALVAEIVAQFLRNFDARRGRCWIAERDGARARNRPSPRCRVHRFRKAGGLPQRHVVDRRSAGRGPANL